MGLLLLLLKANQQNRVGNWILSPAIQVSSGFPCGGEQDGRRLAEPKLLPFHPGHQPAGAPESSAGNSRLKVVSFFQDFR
jgi:hypothetical protein